VPFAVPKQEGRLTGQNWEVDMAYKQVPISYTPTSGITLQTGKGLTLSQYTTKQKWSTTKRFSVTPTGSIIGSPTEAHTYTRNALAKQHQTTGPRSVALPGHHVTKTQPKQTGFPVQPLTSFVTHATPSRTTKGTFPRITYPTKPYHTPVHTYVGSRFPLVTTPNSPIQPHQATGATTTPNPPIVTPYTRSPYTVQAPTPMVVTRTTTAASSTTGTKKWWLIGAVVAVGGGLYLWYRHKKQQGSEAFQ
jgi:hypothetical protein